MTVNVEKDNIDLAESGSSLERHEVVERFREDDLHLERSG